MKVNNEGITDDKEKAEMFNKFFSSYSDINTSHAALPANVGHIAHSLDQIQITEKEISDLIMNIDTSKATGCDLVSSSMLKQAGDSIVPSLTRLFNVSLHTGAFPNSWKLANVTPIFKKNDKSLIDNYSPVSLLSCVGKLFERAVFKHVFNFLRDNNIISLKQSGFIPGDSTSYQLVHLHHLFTEALENQKDIRIVFCDISKAFDRVWHEGLLFKLRKIGINGSLLQWFSNYLYNRKQRVVINGQHSSWSSIKAGVPQGSVLGPLLFLIYINDITSVIQSEVRLFADDTIVYVFVDNPSDSADALNLDLANMTDWANQWLVRFSPPKTVTLNISKKKKKLPRPPLSMDNTVLKEVKSHKHLGVTISNDLSWKEHIESISVSASQCLDVLNALKYKLDRATLERLYFSFVRSKLEYSSIVWDNCFKYEKDLIENVQLRAAKIVSGAINKTSRELIYKELGWDSLEERRRKQRLVVMFKIKNNLAPVYLQEVIRPHDIGYDLRNQNRIPTIRCKTATLQKSFFPQTITDWNNLDPNIRKSEDIKTFKTLLFKDSNAKKTPEWFNSGKRFMALIHGRLRMLCSTLKDHLYSHIHVIDSPQCPCGHQRETTQHFLLQCPLFLNERQSMLKKLSDINFNPTIQNLLYGNKGADVKTNITAFSIVQSFIEESGRFSD